MVYRIDRNNFYKAQKKSTISTPQKLSYFLFTILDPVFRPLLQKQTPLHILDPCVGSGSLLEPFTKGFYKCIGIDIEEQGFPNTIVQNYLTITRDTIPKPALTIMNPPFNIDTKTQDLIHKKYGSRPLLPEIWLKKTLELFGKKIPIVMFTPYGFRLNQSQQSARWQQFARGNYPEITSIISLPKDVFEGILFHSEILIFNIQGLKAHYFYHG